MKNCIEEEFQGIWTRLQSSGDSNVTARRIYLFATERGLTVTEVQARNIGLFRPIPAVVLEVAGRKACFPAVTASSPEWQKARAKADHVAALWKKVDWFSPLWINNQQNWEILAALEHRSNADAIQRLDYHLSTIYTLPFQAVCVAQLMPKARSLAQFAPLAREAYLAFYSGHRASSVAALMPVIEGAVMRIASALPGLKYLDAVDQIVGQACGLAADLYFDKMWTPKEYHSVDFLFGLDERVFAFETFRRWLRECFFQDTDKYTGVSSLNRHLFAHGTSSDWQRPTNFSRLVVAITTLGVIESWHDNSHVISLFFPEMNEDATLLWQQALLRGQLQMSLNLYEQTMFQTHGRLIPELPTDDGIMLRKALLSEDAIKDLVRPLRDAGWSVHITEPDDAALFVVATATSGGHRLLVALLFSCASSNELYRDLAKTVDVILYRGPPYHQSVYAAGVNVHVGPVTGWQPPPVVGSALDG